MGGPQSRLEPSLAASLRSGRAISSLSPGVHLGCALRTVGMWERLLVEEAFARVADPRPVLWRLCVSLKDGWLITSACFCPCMACPV